MQERLPPRRPEGRQVTMLTISRQAGGFLRSSRTLAFVNTGDMRTNRRTLLRSNRNRIQREVLRGNLIATFNLLADTFALERQCGIAYSRRPAEETLRRWNLCRRTVRRLGKDYADSVARYRKAVKDSFTRRMRAVR